MIFSLLPTFVAPFLILFFHFPQNFPHQADVLIPWNVSVLRVSGDQPGLTVFFQGAFVPDGELPVFPFDVVFARVWSPERPLHISLWWISFHICRLSEMHMGFQSVLQNLGEINITF